MIDVAEICKKAKAASYESAGYSVGQKNAMLGAVSDALSDSCEIALLKEANALDVRLARENGKDETFIDRLTLNEKRIAAMIDGLNQVKALADPVGEVVERRILDNGLEIERVRAPLGVIGIIYEARPNVTIDAVALCIKSGNAVVLRGSKDALNSNRALYDIMRKAISSIGLNADCIAFIDDASRDAGKEMLAQEEYIDVIIPRGGEGLKHFVLENAKMPVIASAGGNCHIFVDKSADFEKALDIIVNAKIQRPSVCNAAEHLLVDASIAEEFLPLAYAALKDAHEIEIIGDERSAKLLGTPLACQEDYATEFLGYKMTFAVVDGVKTAVEIINRYGTRHSEAIVAQDLKAQRYFADYVDAAAVYINASTRFTDGFEFGLGAEMGISTQKLHARGPIALKELTSIKYVVSGNGHIRK